MDIRYAMGLRAHLSGAREQQAVIKAAIYEEAARRQAERPGPGRGASILPFLSRRKWQIAALLLAIPALGLVAAGYGRYDVAWTTNLAAVYGVIGALVLIMLASQGSRH